MSLTGILLDVSGSMKSNIGSGTDEEGGPWARSIFQVIDDIIKHDVSSDDRVFAIGFGASVSPQIFDVIGTVREIPVMFKNETPATVDNISNILNILEVNGARNVRNWATVDLIQNEVSDNMAELIITKLKSDERFLRKFVYEFLPRACRDKIDSPSVGILKKAGAMGFRLGGPVGMAICAGGVALCRAAAARTEDAVSREISKARPATAEDIKDVVEKVKRYLTLNLTYSNRLKDVGDPSIFNVQEASRIIRGCVDEKELTAERSRDLLKNVEPYIYGGTPLYESLNKATELFQRSKTKNKLLFVLSDGEPADGPIDDTDLKFIQVVFKLKRAGVTIVSCFITKSEDIQPKQLYDQIPDDWENGAKFLFSLSSTLETRRLPSAMLIKRGWEIDTANNETKLFVQVNHPDNLRKACNMAKDVVYSADSLSELLASVKLDQYINEKIDEFEKEKRKKQVGGTCYAHASAAVLHLAMKRILGREGRENGQAEKDGYPAFHTLKEEMIEIFKHDGAIIEDVLNKMCPIYRLRWKKVDVKKAMEAIVEKRPVLAKFYHTSRELEILHDFFKFHEPKGILTEKEINIKNPTRRPDGGHAVVLTSYNRDCLTLMNSWGPDWGDNGFFRVKNAEVLDLQFYDVYWTEDDLTPGEKEYYRQHGSEVANELMTSFKGLQKAEYTCPQCNQSSLVTEFRGALSEVECPKCLEKFSTNDGEGNSLALNIYLKTLSR